MDSQFREQLKCPISQMYFLDPVVAKDNHVYERACIGEWLEKKTTSPITRQQITKELIPILSIKNIVEELMKHDESVKNERYKPDMSYMSNKDEIWKIISRKTLGDLIKFNEFHLADKNLYNLTLVERIYTNGRYVTEEVFAHIVNNSIDLYIESEINGRIQTPANYLLDSRRVKFIKYSVKYFDIDYIDSNGNILLNKMLIKMCNASNDNNIEFFKELIKELVSKKHNVNKPNNLGIPPLTYALVQNNTSLVKLFLENVADPNYVLPNGIPLIAVCCMFSDLEHVKLMIQHGANINITINGISMLNFVCFLGNYDGITEMVNIQKNYNNSNNEAIEINLVEYQPIILKTKVDGESWNFHLIDKDIFTKSLVEIIIESGELSTKEKITLIKDMELIK